MIIYAGPQTEFLKHEFFTGHPPFINSLIIILIKADWYKTGKIHFSVLFPLA